MMERRRRLADRRAGSRQQAISTNQRRRDSVGWLVRWNQPFQAAAAESVGEGGRGGGGRGGGGLNEASGAGGMWDCQVMRIDSQAVPRRKVIGNGQQ